MTTERRRQWHFWQWRVLAVLPVALSACRWIRPGDARVFAPVPAATVQRVGTCAPSCRDSLDIVALGSAGYLFVPWRDTTQLVLTPPSITNPAIPWLVFGDLLFGTRTDSARVVKRLRALPAVGASRLGRVQAVLVGHGHYDHVMDLPPLAPLLPNATVYGSPTVANLLAPIAGISVQAVSSAPAASVHAVNDVVHVRALAWQHAPNITLPLLGAFTIARGEQRTPLTRVPRTVHGWRMGEPLAWVVDIRDGRDSVGARLVFHDAAAGPEVQRAAGRAIAGLPHARTTVLIMSAANFDQVAHYPDILLAHLAPDHVILGHWEDFFRASDKPPRIVRGIAGRELVQRLMPYVRDRWSAPTPGAVVRVRW